MNACLERLTRHLDPTRQPSPGPATAVERMLTAHVEAPEMFSPNPIQTPTSIPPSGGMTHLEA
ncbi:hypothetical protein Pen02_56840 [Plantactinospora endophytica]|uniref:Uncharacterized protein n=1 Tax=Plantactinospora endophytica TaxID=673535 RepID=A0ABQ4E7S4_9ACTN|nr:hypothetical protein Pen02_56840 [Plantactinospora endophytica]